jgi:hypothetical protein
MSCHAGLFPQHTAVLPVKPLSTLDNVWNFLSHTSQAHGDYSFCLYSIHLTLPHISHMSAVPNYIIPLKTKSERDKGGVVRGISYTRARKGEGRDFVRRFPASPARPSGNSNIK